MNARVCKLLAVAAALALGACSQDIEAAAPTPPAFAELGDEWRHLGANTARVSTARTWDGQLDGPVTFWHDDGVKMGEGLYQDDEKQGAWSFWHENGALRWQGVFVRGVPSGAQRAWFDNGVLHYEANWKDGRRDGPFRSWHDNAQLAFEGRYVAGELDGEVRAWNEDGELDEAKSGVYRAGEKLATPPSTFAATAK